MPSPYSSEGTEGDARAIAANLGTDFMEIGDRGRRCSAYDEALERAFAGREPDIAEENLQARIRGNVVMALSNKFGWLVLTTGNKSELSVGYATLYGDMAGGFAVLKDVFKGWVYRLVRWRNEQEGRDARARQRARAPAVRRAARTSSATRTRCRPTTCSTRSSPATSSRTSTPPSWSRAGPARRGGRAGDPDGRPGRVQAPPGAARASRSRPRRSAATGACRSPTATSRACERPPLRAVKDAGRTAIVTRERAHRRPSSSVNSTSQTQVVRPRCLRRASAWTVPSVTGRRKLVWFDWPMAIMPSGHDRHGRRVGRRRSPPAPRRRRRGRSRTAGAPCR